MVIKKTVEGYIAREDEDLVFSNLPMHKDGFFGDGGVWYDTLETEEESSLNLRVDMHEYLDIPELTFDNSPRRCKLTFEIGEQLPNNTKEDIDRRVKAIKMCHHIQELAEAAGKTFDETKEALCSLIPEVAECFKEDSK